nr:hypothetical protein [Tanacetum cinerariifolium]
MARTFTFFTLVFLLLTSLGLNVKGRPIIDAERIRYVNGVVANAKDIVDLETKYTNLWEVKNSGPSSGGRGHKFPTVESFGNIKISGPSYGGKGHGSPNGVSLDEIKIFGPSSGGNGHKFPAGVSFGNIKNPGPSPGGKGHGSPMVDSLGSIKNSGPSPGGKRHGSPNAESLGDIKNSGPSAEERTKDLHTADYTQLYDFLKYNQKEVDGLKVERIAKIQDPLALMANFNNPYAFPAPHQDLLPFNQNYMQQPIPNPEDITDPTTAMNMALALMAKSFKLNYSTPTNNNQRISSNPRNIQMQMIRGNGGNQFRQNAGNLNGYNAVQKVRNQVAQNPRVQNVGNQ